MCNIAQSPHPSSPFGQATGDFLVQFTMQQGLFRGQDVKQKGRTVARPFLSLFLDNTIDDGVDSAVFLSSLGCVVVGDASDGTVSLGAEAGSIDPEIANQVVHHVIGALLGELHVVLFAANVVGVPLDKCGGRRILLHVVTDLVDFVIITGLNLGAIRRIFHLQGYAEPLGWLCKLLDIKSTVDDSIDAPVFLPTGLGYVIGYRL